MKKAKKKSRRIALSAVRIFICERQHKRARARGVCAPLRGGAAGGGARGAGYCLCLPLVSERFVYVDALGLLKQANVIIVRGQQQQKKKSALSRGPCYEQNKTRDGHMRTGNENLEAHTPRPYEDTPGGPMSTRQDSTREQPQQQQACGSLPRLLVAAWCSPLDVPHHSIQK